MESDDKGDLQNPVLVVEDTESDANLVDAPEVQEAEQSVNPTISTSAFKKILDYFRTKKPPRPQKYVEGWPEDSPAKNPQDNDSRQHSFDNGLSPYHAIQEQQWEQLSGYSSQLGTVKTTSLSAVSQSVVRSRGTTQSTVNRSSSSELRRSIERRSTDIEGLKSFRGPSSIDEEAQKRAIKRRQVIQEIIRTELDYVLGLKSLAGVSSHFDPVSELCFLTSTSTYRSSPSSKRDRPFTTTSRKSAKSTNTSLLNSRTSRHPSQLLLMLSLLI